MDVDRVAACLPGCERFEPIGEDQYRATLTIGVAAITGTYQGTVGILDKRPGESYRMSVEGSGRPGFVRGESLIVLFDRGDQTVVEVSADVQVGGTVARVGQRLLGSASKMMMDRFFACMQKSVLSGGS